MASPLDERADLDLDERDPLLVMEEDDLREDDVDALLLLAVEGAVADEARALEVEGGEAASVGVAPLCKVGEWEREVSFGGRWGSSTDAEAGARTTGVDEDVGWRGARLVCDVFSPPPWLFLLSVLVALSEDDVGSPCFVCGSAWVVVDECDVDAPWGLLVMIGLRSAEGGMLLPPQRGGKAVEGGEWWGG